MSESLSANAAEIALESTRPGGGGTAVPPPPAGVRRRRRGLGGRARLEIALLSGPAVLVFTVFVIVPIFFALYYSFFRWKSPGPPPTFIGWTNYTWTLTNPDFWKSIEHNLIIAVLSLVIQGPISIGLALLLNQKMRGRSVIRVLIFVPYVIAEVVVGIGWSLMLQDTGAINALLHRIGIDKTISWISDPKIALWTLMFVISWKYIGFAIILMLAGLQGIPEELSEAAAVDGASYWQTQRYIMLPLLSPTIRIWAFLSIIGSLQLFDLVYIIWGQYIAPIAGTSTMVWFMSYNGRLAGQLGRGSAITIIVFFICLFVAFIYQRFVLRRDTEGALTEKED